MMGAVLVIIDGLSDNAFVEGAWPYLRAKAKNIGFGYLDNGVAGRDSDSLSGIGTLLGLTAEEIPQGRAYLEALSQGIVDERPVFRCNLVTVCQGKLTAAYGQGLREAEIPALWQAVRENLPPEVTLYPLASNRALVKWRGFCEKTTVYAPHQHLQDEIMTWLPSWGQARDLVTRSAEWLADFNRGGCAYWLWLWDLSLPCVLPQLKVRQQMSGAMVAQTPLVRGMALAMGMDCPPLNRATADCDTDLAEKRKMALALLKQYELVVVHLNGADEAAHRLDCRQKRGFLRRVQAEILRPLAATGARLLVCADHGTACQSGAHFGGLQPFYCVNCGAGGYLGIHKGREAIDLLRGV